MTYEYDFKSGRLRKRKGSSSGQAGSSSSLVDRYFRGPFLDGEEDKSWIPESSVMPNKDGDGERASEASSHRYGRPAEAGGQAEAEAEAEEYYRVRSERTAAGRAADYQQITTARENRRRDSPRRQKSV